jgi:hypothetical protein
MCKLGIMPYALVGNDKGTKNPPAVALGPMRAVRMGRGTTCMIERNRNPTCPQLHGLAPWPIEAGPEFIHGAENHKFNQVIALQQMVRAWPTNAGPTGRALYLVPLLGGARCTLPGPQPSCCGAAGNKGTVGLPAHRAHPPQLMRTLNSAAAAAAQAAARAQPPRPVPPSPCDRTRRPRPHRRAAARWSRTSA